jgi:N-acetylglucosamine-6-phosphate deacetylase
VEARNGKCLVDGKLAGSVLTLEHAVRNVMQFARFELQQAVRLATLNPARVAGLTGRGELSAGAVADFVVLSPGGEVKNTIIRGAGI